MDNFLLTDEEAYDRSSDDELSCDEIGTLPKYNVFDASFLSKGDVFVVTAVFVTSASIKSYCWCYKLITARKKLAELNNKKVKILIETIYAVGWAAGIAFDLFKNLRKSQEVLPGRPVQKYRYVVWCVFRSHGLVL